jgi:oxygen-independent coproporphyrinogen III oxidase
MKESVKFSIIIDFLIKVGRLRLFLIRLLESRDKVVQAVYIHIPFCEQICHYCDFNKVFLRNQPVDDYLNALDLEMKEALARINVKNIQSIYVGGGTPTALNVNQTEKLVSIIHKNLLPCATETVEYTFEANPGDLPLDKLKVLLDGGVNRLSMGVQTFDDELLKSIGRSHRAEDVHKAVSSAQQVGFENINVDLIYALPNQTIESFQETLNAAFSLNVQHFSGYSLQVEPKTVFYNLLRKGKLPLPGEDLEADMLELLMNNMERNGYSQYEISNFSLPGKESRHNLTYWDNSEYFGFGAGAHGYVNGYRNVNAGPINKYISLLNEKGDAFIEQHFVTKEEKMEEEMFLGLRKMSGVSKDRFYDHFGVRMEHVFSEQLKDLIGKGLLHENEKNVSLTRKGRFLGNEVFQSFLAAI